MTTAFRHLCVKAEAFRRRYARELPAGLRAEMSAQHLLTRWRGEGRPLRPTPRLAVRYLLQVYVAGPMRRWVASLSWNAGQAPSTREVRWAVAEGLLDVELEDAWCERRLRARERRARRGAP